MTRQPPYARDVNTVFQDYALFPHMTVIENVEYGLKIRKVAKPERRRRAEQMLDMVRLSGLERAKTGPAVWGSAPACGAWPGPSSTSPRCSCSTSHSGRST